MKFLIPLLFVVAVAMGCEKDEGSQKSANVNECSNTGCAQKVTCKGETMCFASCGCCPEEPHIAQLGEEHKLGDTTYTCGNEGFEK